MTEPNQTDNQPLNDIERARLRKRLRQLGVVEGRHFVPKPKPEKHTSPPLAGDIVETWAGPCFVLHEVAAPGFMHGSQPLQSWLQAGPETLLHLSDNPPALRGIRPEQCLFLDIETTGLGGGGGLLPFLVGVGRFESSGAFVLWQFFLRTPAEERAMLAALQQLIGDDVLVTFNGRGFDVPILLDRAAAHGLEMPLNVLRHIDLLVPARRLWARRLGSMALARLESHLLRVYRSDEDVPGWLIPKIYKDYQATGQTLSIRSVLYHNRIDILSTVMVGRALCSLFEAEAEQPMAAEDRLSLARWYLAGGAFTHCEAAYRAVLAQADDSLLLYEALTGLSDLLRRLDRRAEAVDLWEQMAAMQMDALPYEELSKHYEWHERDLVRALEWTERGIGAAKNWPGGVRRAAAVTALERRRERLLKKVTR